MKKIFNFPFTSTLHVLFALLLVWLTSCGGPAGSGTSSDSTSTKNPGNGTTAEPPRENWSYSQDSDKMTSKINYYASVQANEELQLKAPYDGGATATLTVRNITGKNEVLLKVSKGQFLAGIDEENIQVRFDTSKAETYSCSGPSDYSTTVLFVTSAAKFVASLKKAKKLLIGAEMYDNGIQQMEFNVEGLKWQ